MATTKNSSSMTEEVYKEIYEQIINGEFELGSPIVITTLKERYNVSLAVIREALLRLTSKGVVIQKPNQGFAVIELSSEKVADIIEARKINESGALRLAMTNGDMAWESKIIAQKYELDNTPMFSNTDKSKQGSHLNPLWAQKHYEFHMSMLSACNNDVLLSICDDLWNLSRIYRSHALFLQKDRKIADEHTRLMQAVLQRDQDNAIDLFISHIKETGNIPI